MENIIDICTLNKFTMKVYSRINVIVLTHMMNIINFVYIWSIFKIFDSWISDMYACFVLGLNLQEVMSPEGWTWPSSVLGMFGTPKYFYISVFFSYDEIELMPVKFWHFKQALSERDGLHTARDSFANPYVYLSIVI